MLTRAARPPAVGDTPLVVLRASVQGVCHTIFLKDERVNPTGSIKDRTAQALITAATQVNTSLPTGIVESTSGNLGVALALQAKHRGLRFLAVVDPRLTTELRAKIRALGGEIEFVDRTDAEGNYLDARIARARELAGSGRWLWTNQYESKAAVEVHRRYTGPEVRCQVDGHLDELFVAVSTGGTMVGLGQYLLSSMPSCTRIAVNVEGSRALGLAARERHITGVGSAQPSRFDVRPAYDELEIVTEADAIRACRILSDQARLGVGASTGAAVAGCLRRLRQSHRPLRALCFIADGSENYTSTVYNDDWIRDHRIELGATDWAETEFEVAGTISSARP